MYNSPGKKLNCNWRFSVTIMMIIIIKLWQYFAKLEYYKSVKNHPIMLTNTTVLLSVHSI
jgi:hypothetical protein